MEQLWLFWLAPIIGAAIAGVLYSAVLEVPEPEKQAAFAAAAGGKQR